MRKTLLPFQVEGAARLAANYHHLLADEPGLGKTLQAIAAVESVGARDVLVVCPASVRSNWKKEILDCQGEYDSRHRWDVISYNEAQRGDLRGRYDVCVLDEGHFLKTPDSLRTRAVLGKDGLARRASFIWPLTGTPALNRPRELWPVLKTLHPAFAKMSFAHFAQRYCGAYFNGHGMESRGATHVEELASLLGAFMTRRTKRQVFPDRKAPLVSLVPLEVTREELAAVRAAEDAMLDREAYLSPTHEKFAQLGDLASLLRLTGVAKVGAVSDYVDELLETVEKVVVFFKHSEVGRRLHREPRWRAAMYEGGMTDFQKDYAVRCFRENPLCRVFLGQIQAAGTGINGLQDVCSDVVFAEQSWVPGEMAQAIDRLDRMGQEADIVTARVLHAPGTLESAVLRVRERKAGIVGRLMADGRREILGGLA